MKTINIKLTGIAPLIMQSDLLADPLNPATIKLSEIPGGKKRTPSQHLDYQRLEMRHSIYYSDQAGVHLPAANLTKCLIEAARLSKEGKLVERGVQITEDEIPLTYPGGPKKIDQLIEDPDHRYRKTVVVGKARVIRTRPIFRDWSCKFSIIYDENQIKTDSTLVRLLNNAGSYVGLGGRRIGRGGQFGRFTAEIV